MYSIGVPFVKIELRVCRPWSMRARVHLFTCWKEIVFLFLLQTWSPWEMGVPGMSRDKKHYYRLANLAKVKMLSLLNDIEI